ncbi:hypothetical protein KY290_033508 [Solanum tuberosum]|uniref:CCHC-type domain-containing protein n=1 Tax=Solanum tuberosum TaxID=4113 RepID=A0ABQ7U451_SOLTU|nr:hypothetical protein KY290_033508 [Solanum tuberosum]
MSSVDIVQVGTTLGDYYSAIKQNNCSASQKKNLRGKTLTLRDIQQKIDMLFKSMNSHHFESFSVRFTGKNYSSWEFQFQLFVTGKELWGHIDGSDPAPTDTTKLGEWKIQDARVMTWILGSIDPLIVLNLRPDKTAKAMWDYLQKVYNQDNSARRFQLEYDIANYSQGGIFVQDYFSGFQNLWAEFTDIVYAKIPVESLSMIQAVHEQSKRDQFLMKLCSDFKCVRSNLMNRDPSPSLDVCFRELLREEQRLVTQNAFKKENDVTVAFAAQGKGKGRDMSRTQCYSCKEYGHIASNCSKKFCNYCKQQGHIIKECPMRPQNHRINAFQARINGSTNDNSSSGQVLTPEMVQQMIVSAFSALGLQGNDVTSNFWIVDSGASNHMTNSTSILKDVRKYQGPSQIHIANGSNLPITKDQVSGTIIAKGPKLDDCFLYAFPFLLFYLLLVLLLLVRLRFGISV